MVTGAPAIETYTQPRDTNTDIHNPLQAQTDLEDVRSLRNTHEGHVAAIAPSVDGHARSVHVELGPRSDNVLQALNLLINLKAAL